MSIELGEFTFADSFAISSQCGFLAKGFPKQIHSSIELIKPL